MLPRLFMTVWCCCWLVVCLCVCVCGLSVCRLGNLFLDLFFCFSLVFHSEGWSAKIVLLNLLLFFFSFLLLFSFVLLCFFYSVSLFGKRTSIKILVKFWFLWFLPFEVSYCPRDCWGPLSCVCFSLTCSILNWFPFSCVCFPLTYSILDWFPFCCVYFLSTYSIPNCFSFSCVYFSST